MMPTREQLAALVLAVLDAQAEFFRSGKSLHGPRREALLAECKEQERHLRRVCKDIQEAAKPKQPGLFDSGTGGLM